MGREVRRVPLDFDWPLHQVWQGFLEPERLHGQPCTFCDSSGQTDSAHWLDTLFRRIEMLASDVLFDQKQGKPLHPWLARDPNPPRRRNNDPDPIRALVDPAYRESFEIKRPSADILDLFRAADPERKIEGVFDVSHRSLDLQRAMFRGLGLSYPDADNDWKGGWGICTHCHGKGATEKYPGQFAEAEAWQSEEPPTGEGYQLWETVSEGSPVSPVFATAQELAEWMAGPASVRGRIDPQPEASSVESALRFIEKGWAPSFVVSNGVGQSGVDFAGRADPVDVQETDPAD